MTAQLTAPEASTRPELIEFRKQDAAIAKLREQYMPLKINGLEDKEGFAKVHDARMIVKNTRVSVEKKRVELKADALAYGRAVDAEAKRLTELLSPIESHLEAEEDAIVQERERIKKEAERKRQAMIQDRVDKFMACGVVPNITDVAALTDEQFAESLAAAQKAKEEREAAAEAQRKAEAEAAEKRKEEEAALAAERARLEEMQRQQKAESDRLAAERKKLDDERLARERAAELEKAKAEAAEKARVEAEQRHAEELAKVKAEAEAKAVREKAEAEEKARREKEEAEAAEAERIKAEQERPQRQKLAAIADKVEAIAVPVGPGSDDVNAVLVKAAADIRTISKRRSLGAK